MRPHYIFNYMKIRKRVIVASFHIVVATAYLLMWLAKWSATSSVMERRLHIATQQTKVWHTPAADAISEIKMLEYEDQVCYISAYDDIYHRVSNDLGTNWCLMSAIGYIESRFKPHVRSKSGAMGIMQIMPRTAAIYGVSNESAMDPEVNIRVASMHYNLIDYMLNIPDYIPERDRIALNLASYNGGIGRVHDAQRLARHMGEDPYSWSSIAQQLKNLQEAEFYELDIIQNGRFGTARHTVWYVNQVLRRYDLYCIRTAQCSHHLYPVTGHRYE